MAQTHAVIATGGKQYIVTPGKTYTFEKLPVDAGSAVTFTDVLLTFGEDGSDVAIGTPKLPTTVTGTVVAQRRARKVTVIKYKAKSRYRRKHGHRQHETQVKIEAIGGAVVVAPEKPKAPKRVAKKA